MTWERVTAHWTWASTETRVRELKWWEDESWDCNKQEAQRTKVLHSNDMTIKMLELELVLVDIKIAM